MAIDKKVVDYVKTQLKAGYTQDQIKTALANSGYRSNDIKQAMSSAGTMPTAGPVKGVKSSSPSGGGNPVVGFWVSLIGGVVILLAAILPMVSLTIFSDISSFFPMILNLGEMITILGIIIGAVALIGAVLINMMPDNKIPGIIVLVISVIALLVNPDFFLGAIVGIVGGVLAVIGK
ncbi:MAG: hypothetical protein ACYSR7_04275 [Planctomycetota bacterium]